MKTWARVVVRDLAYIAPYLAAIVALGLAGLFSAHAGWLHVEFVVWPERVLLFALGAHVVLIDPVGGGLAQWRTRPVPGGSMAVGKTVVLACVAFGMGIAMFAAGLLSGSGVWPGLTLGVWEIFRSALWVMLGAALAVLVESARGFVAVAAGALTLSAAAVAVLFMIGRESEFVASLVVRGAREHGRAVMLAGALAMVFSFSAVARRYMWPHRCWTARGLALAACLFVLGHEGLRLLVR